MAVSPARQFACDILMAVEERSAYAGDLLHGAPAAALSAADRRLATEIVMGVLRWQGQLDYVIERAAGRKPGRIDQLALVALRMGVYQLRFLDRIPAMAAVHESVELVKRRQPRVAGFVNAVLRHTPNEPVAALLAGVGDLGLRRSVEYSHPAWMLERWSAHFGPERAAAIAEYDNTPPPVAVRIASDRVDLAETLAALAAQGIELAPGALLRTAHRVARGDITKTTLFQGGGVWVQDEGSQLMASLMQPRNGERILDACAAPGGKTALLRTLAPQAQLVAMDVHAHRVRLLERLLRDPAIETRVADATQPLPAGETYDRILVDAPCSGTGTLARNPEIKWRLQAAGLAALGGIQEALLGNLTAALRPGGRMVYSVCSLEPEEGPRVIERLLASHAGIRLVPAPEVVGALAAEERLLPELGAGAALCESDYLRLLPGAFASDGFFAAVLQRR